MCIRDRSPPGAGIAQRIYKFAKSPVGKVLTGTIERVISKVMQNIDKGVYNDKDGKFDIDKVLDSKAIGALICLLYTSRCV